MRNVFNFFLLLSFNLFAEEALAVRLSTKTPLKTIYLSEARIQGECTDWRYIDELRGILAQDLSTNGFSSLLLPRSAYEEKIRRPDPRERFDLSFWQKEHVSFVIAPEMTTEALYITVFHIAKGTSKRYPAVPLTGILEQDRRSAHRLTDQLQKDLFGVQGIASLRILFSQRVQNTTSAKPEWLSDIWMTDSDGMNPQRLTLTQGYCMSPGFLPTSLSPSETGYFYVSSEKGQSAIYRASLSDTKGSRWIKLRGSQLLAAVNRAGTQLAFISDAAGRPDLFVQNLDSKGNPVGQARQIFSAPRATQASPSYSPDGKQLAFVSDKEGTPKIYLIEVHGVNETKKNQPRLISRKNRENTAPSWSPDGKQLAYSARAEGVRQIWIYDFENDTEWQLTTGPEHKENPSWAPDSLHLIYNTETDDVSELFVINLRQKEPRRITTGFGQKRFACWQVR